MWPVLFTHTARTDTVHWELDSTVQDESGRAWDVFWMLRIALLRRRDEPLHPGLHVPFDVHRVAPGDSTATTTELHAICALNDNHEPCWIVAEPNED